MWLTKKSIEVSVDEAADGQQMIIEALIEIESDIDFTIWSNNLELEDEQ